MKEVQVFCQWTDAIEEQAEMNRLGKGIGFQEAVSSDDDDDDDPDAYNRPSGNRGGGIKAADEDDESDNYDDDDQDQYNIVAPTKKQTYSKPPGIS